MQSWMIHFFIVLFMVFSVTDASSQQATIRAFYRRSIDVHADSNSYITILEYFQEPTLLNISQVQFQTAVSSSTTTPTSTIPQYLHLVLLYLPPVCSQDFYATNEDGQSMCDFHHLGIGIEGDTDDNDIKGDQSKWCCTPDLQQQGDCQRLNQLIIQQDKFQGQEHAILVPQESDTIFALGDIAGIFDIPQKGDYAFLLANCKEDGLDLRSIPLLSAKDRVMEEFQDYYICLTFYHFFLFLAYIFVICTSRDAVIWPIQKWLGVTMAIAALDVLLLCINYSPWFWNRSDDDSWVNVFTVSVAVGGLKRGISMCVGVMVAMGWGRTRYSLGVELVLICIYGFVYTAIVLVHEISNALLETNLDQEIMARGGDLTAMGSTFAVIILVMDIIFVVWILMSIRSTIVHLKSNAIDQQVQREQVSHHRVLGGLFTFSMIAISPAWIIQLIERRRLLDNRPFELLLTPDHWSYMNATIQGIYTITLTGVASLWIPKSSSTLQENCTEMKKLQSTGINGDMHDGNEEYEDYGTGSNRFKDDDGGNDPDHPKALLVNSGHLS